MALSDYKVKHELRIDWSELDYFKHVNNVSFFKYIQSARVNYWEQIGLSRLHLETNTGAMLASTHCDFKKPLVYPGVVKILSQVNFIKTTSFGIQHLLLNNNEEMVAEAQDILVMFDFNKNEKITLPLTIRNAIEKLEARSF